MPVPELSLSSLYRTLPERVRQFGQPHSTCHLMRLAPELLTEEIMVELVVEDILSLRQTSKFFYGLTHAPIIWRRLLRRINIPLPPIRPTFRYDLRQTDLEIEQLVARGISMDYNWRKYNPTAEGYKSFVHPHIIREMKLVPGSKFLIASTQVPGRDKYFIQILALDTHSVRGGRVLCELEIQGKGFNLAACYITHKGKYGIAVAYQTRSIPLGQAYPSFNPNVFSAKAKIDAPGPLRYDISCLFTPLDVLEAAIVADFERRDLKTAFSKQKKLPQPFVEIAHMKAMSQFYSLVFFEKEKVPYFGCVVQPKTIVFANLHSGRVLTITMKEYKLWSDAQTWIHSFHPLPDKNSLVLIRTLNAGTLSGLNADYHCIESANFTLEAEDSISVDTIIRLQFRELPGGASGVDFFFSEPEIRPRVAADLPPNVRVDKRHVTPISIFARVRDPPSFYHWDIWPTCSQLDPSRDPTYEFGTLDNHVTPQSLRMSTASEMPYILPGTSHTLVFMVDSKDRTEFPHPLQMYRYINPEAYPDDPGYIWPPGGEQVGFEGIMRRPRLQLPARRFCRIGIPERIMDVFDKKKNGDMSAVAWDGHTGRLCFGMEKDSRIHVVDFGSCSNPDELMWKWMKSGEKVDDFQQMGLGTLLP